MRRGKMEKKEEGQWLLLRRKTENLVLWRFPGSAWSSWLR